MTDVKALAKEYAGTEADDFKNNLDCQAFLAGFRAALSCPEVEAIREALEWSSEMLTARDEMNSKVHCAPVRLSPITERVSKAASIFDALKKRAE